MSNGTFYRDTYAEINLDAIRHNVRAFRLWLPQKTDIMAIVKANAYGHGAPQVAKEALKSGARYLGVATLDEAIELQDRGVDAPILVMGYIPEQALPEAIQRNIHLTFYHPEYLQQVIVSAASARKPAILHLKVETGMGRLGAYPSEVPALVKQALGSEWVRLEGLFTHFACADEGDKTYTHWQADRFARVLQECEGLGADFSLVHCGNSATAIDLPQYGYNLVRIGISLYGLYPSHEVERQHVVLKPAMSLKTRIVHLKKMPPGSGVSYGASYRTEGEETIATLPIGYGDGLNRLLSNRGNALVRGRRVPIVGRICMNQTMLRLPDDLGAELGDEAVLYGQQGDEEISVDEVARLLGTINYEVTTMVSARVPRVYKHQGMLSETFKDHTKKL